MGVPVVTLLGDWHSGRVGASILHAIGMADLLVTESVDSYVEKAVAWANDKKQLKSIKKIFVSRCRILPFVMQYLLLKISKLPI